MKDKAEKQMSAENRENTPGSVLSDTEYRECIVEKYGHIRGLAKTLLFIRKGSSRDKSAARDDAMRYHKLKQDIDSARKILNRLHVRLMYAENEKSYADIPYTEIQKMIESAQTILSGAKGSIAVLAQEQQAQKEFDKMGK